MRFVLFSQPLNIQATWAHCVSVAKCYSLGFRVVPVRAGGWCSTPGADRGGSRLHIHPTAKQFQIHVHLPSVTTKKLVQIFT